MGLLHSEQPPHVLACSVHCEWCEHQSRHEEAGAFSWSFIVPFHVPKSSSYPAVFQLSSNLRKYPAIFQLSSNMRKFVVAASIVPASIVAQFVAAQRDARAC